MSEATADPPSELDVVHDDEGHRYLLRRDGEHVGVIDYRPTDDGAVLDMHHTEIRPGVRGGGLGAVLVRRALDDVRESGRQVIPTCWYVRDFIAEHEDYQPLLARP